LTPFQDVCCKFKVAYTVEEVAQLGREKQILEAIRSGEGNGQSDQFVVGWLAPQLLTHESRSIYRLDQSADDFVELAAPMSGLVLEAGGPSLKAYLNAHPYLPVSERVTILRAVAEAVAFLHRVQIVHFDLKPDNIVLFPAAGHQARWKLIDFDSSYDLSLSPALSPSDNFRLTGEYAAPEVLQALDDSPTAVAITEAMDIWSLGMVGVFLFAKETFWTLFDRHRSFSPRLAAELTQPQIAAIVDRRFEATEAGFLTRCLQLKSSDRRPVSESLAGSSLFTNQDSTVAVSVLSRMTSVQEKIDRVCQGLLELRAKTATSATISEVLEARLSELLLSLPGRGGMGSE
jgi:serine/threonine protein kinase